MNNTGIILTLAYPETIVMHADEWYSPYLKYVGIGNKTHVRAGHAALVLINKETGELEYHDFGRYITPEPNGRVRGKDTDNELDFPIIAKISNHKIANLKEILEFLATNPKLTHGDGTLYASACQNVNYDLARAHITNMQNKHFIQYAAFVKDACNCARFVTDSLIASVTNESIKRKLIRSKWFTPSTVGNVVLADTENYVYQVDDSGNIQKFNSTVGKLNRQLFLDKLKDHIPNEIGTRLPKSVGFLEAHAQWLSGIAAGAWFELHKNELGHEYVFRRISPYGNIDVEAVFEVEDQSFNYHDPYQFVHYSNCQFFHIEQLGKVYRFNKKN
ncbi:hypothetical protein C1T31_03870 [Hanstruepera neustonica]|uniref:Uncharacterized protein n=1 Tax=Hanstruepera neustonica TaxID=1445657 RepID=A0A2K1E4R9_9FLAO|nr:DUF6695 family protein [Hanstruepera neustonica]PNQ75279.1 hypothetical protein C1T31_03870 [Hanstruepera neustonica]